MAEIQAGAVPLSDSATEEIKDSLPQMKLKTTRTQLKRKNEKEQDLFGLYAVNLQLSWLSGNSEVQRDLVGRMWRFAGETGDHIFNPYATVALAPWGPRYANLRDFAGFLVSRSS